MKVDQGSDIAELGLLGADRVVAPAGALPQPAQRLDASGPARPHELELSVERLCLDSTSHRQIRERSGGDPDAMAARILEIVEERGKMHNPDTDSGGILLGTVVAAGEAHGSPPPLGERVATLASLTLTPLRLDEVVRVDPDSAQVDVRGTAYVFERSGVAPIPDDFPEPIAVDLFDVCAAANQVLALTPELGTVCVLGAGHAGKLALAAAADRDAVRIAVDVDPAAVGAVEEAGLCEIAVAADLRDPLRALQTIRAAGAPPADLTVVVVNATGCEPTALLLTKDEGSILFFSMATNFSAVALAADGIGTDARLMVGSGRAPDQGAYALDLARRCVPFRRALGLEAA